MSILGNFIKQPAETESYSITYEDDLIGADAIASAVTFVEPLGLTIVTTSVATPRVKVLTSGGTDGVKYKVTVTSTTDDGRILQDEFFIKIKDY